MNHIKLNTAQPIYGSSTHAMADNSDIHYVESNLSETLILGRLRRNVVVNIPSTPALAQ